MTEETETAEEPEAQWFALTHNGGPALRDGVSAPDRLRGWWCAEPSNWAAGSQRLALTW
jgi:hypothetical protein